MINIRMTFDVSFHQLKDTFSYRQNYDDISRINITGDCCLTQTQQFFSYIMVRS